MIRDNQCRVLFGRKDICRFMNISKNTFYELIDEGLPAKKVAGRTWMLNCDDFYDWSRQYNVKGDCDD